MTCCRSSVLLLSFCASILFSSLATATIIATPRLPRIVRLKDTHHHPSRNLSSCLAFKSSSWIRKNGNAESTPSKKTEKKKTKKGEKERLQDDASVLGRIKQSIGNLLFKRIVDSVYDDADSNKDGKISLAEVNTLILNMYVKINRAAPIPPPSRDTVDALFTSADVDGNKRLSRDEFSRLAIVLASRATTRLVAHKIVSFVVAPVLAIKTVEGLSGKHLGDGDLMKRLVPEKMKGRIADANLWKTLLTVVFVKSLGNAVISSVTVVLDAMHLSNDDEDK
mmetsp:Transcript_6112/g.13333  ORF Transcript_6112/g.13333 Transcript_6112/m.13333 type:complete len:280 (-) Transcript_6112:121-960(-)|eukprot:CAMPEP_0178482174 /NCGR_PEP_ID=MMETSP0696-20121128/6591_1 /TAXON_ID=265572 /ORGANISM="Extubocellulus spinifer, Strain CCMP396" /LENGTH=279 /DNA_ID=CAMNT_0020109669 /DNA_START=80 /DNA_END=919 /DNA_ORIENTATION=-